MKRGAWDERTSLAWVVPVMRTAFVGSPNTASTNLSSSSGSLDLDGLGELVLCLACS